MIGRFDVGAVGRLAGNPSSKIHQLALASELRAIRAICELLTLEIGDLPRLDRNNLRDQLQVILERLSERWFAPLLNGD